MTPAPFPTMSRSALLLIPFLVLAGCERPAPEPASPAPAAAEPAPEAEPEFEAVRHVVRINTTSQSWSAGQPWEKESPRRRRSLGAIVNDFQILTTAEMAADATFLELESPDGRKLAPAKVDAVDFEANLALLSLSDPEADGDFFDDMEALEIAEPVARGSQLEIVQVEDNGEPLVTTGTVQGLDVVANFLPGQYFLTYEVKASMQSAASSYSLPALHDQRLAGLLTSYNSKDQICDILGTEILARFLEDAADGDYEGFASLGVSTSSTEDSGFRDWLRLPDETEGLYVSKVRPRSAAAKAGLQKGDVITSIDGYDIDRIGYFDHELYGRLFWSHLVRGSKSAGDELSISVMREGEPLELTGKLERREFRDELVPAYTFDQAPNFLVKGGLVFQELTRPLLEAFGDDWRSRAPLDLLDVLENPENYEESYDRVVFLAGVIATPATVGYEPLRNLIVTEVNGQPARDMKSLIEAFDQVPADGLHAIEFNEEDFTVYLDEVLATGVDQQLIQRGLTRLSRAE